MTAEYGIFAYVQYLHRLQEYSQKRHGTSLGKEQERLRDFGTGSNFGDMGDRHAWESGWDRLGGTGM